MSAIINELAQIPEAHLGPLVDLIHAYRMGLQAQGSDPSTSAGSPSSGRFSGLSGTISSQDAEEMAAAIRGGCERIDTDGW